MLITGGAGFIGCNSAAQFLKQGARVIILDNFSRIGSKNNFEWLSSLGGELILEKIDICDKSGVSKVIKKYKPYAILHLAAQVAVTISVEKPRMDFEVNALGTFNLLESIRLHCPESIVLYASTNKVYGHLDRLQISEEDMRYVFTTQDGVSEDERLEFYSPYGCSKGAADQYVVDYARIYGLKTVSLRQSCIYGYRQFGIEDQGWVAWFIIGHLLGKPITIYGNGKQVRDILFIDDLINCYQMLLDHPECTNGGIYNIGGGQENAISLIEFLSILEGVSGRKVIFKKGETRPGDQPIYISDVKKAYNDFEWRPIIPFQNGIEKVYRWVSDNMELFY